jgi:hypothetical protein
VKKAFIVLCILAIAAMLVWRAQPRWLQEFTSQWISAKPYKQVTDPSGTFIASQYVTGTTAADAETCVNIRRRGEKFMPHFGRIFVTKGVHSFDFWWLSDRKLHIDIMPTPDDDAEVNLDTVAIEYKSKY